jgi:hypothetical protein
MAVLDVSSFDPGRSERANALTGSLSDELGTRHRRTVFRALSSKLGGCNRAISGGCARRITGVDGDQTLPVLTEPRALTSYSIIAGSETGVSLWTIFERDLELFRRKDQTDIATQL